MSYKQKRNKAIYWAFLLLYTGLLIAGSIFALMTVWDFAQKYEASMPEAVIEGYISQLNSDLWEQGLSETMASMEHVYQSDEECKEVVMGLLNGEITYVRSTSSEPDTNAYSLRCGSSSFGKVYLIKDEKAKSTFEVLGKELSLPWDLRPWKVYKQEFDLTGLYTSVEITVPEAYSVQLNGITLGSDNIVERGIQYDSLKEYYDVNPNLPTKCTYRAEGIIGYLEPTVLDENGNEYIIDTQKDDSQYLKACSAEELAALDNFCSKFTESYLRFSSGIMGKHSSGGYAALQAYTIPGGDLDNRLLAALDGLSWAHTYSFRLDEYQLLDALDLGEGYYVCNVMARTTTNTQGNGVREDENILKIIVVAANGEIRALSLA